MEEEEKVIASAAREGTNKIVMELKKIAPASIHKDYPDDKKQSVQMLLAYWIRELSDSGVLFLETEGMDENIISIITVLRRALIRGDEETIAFSSNALENIFRDVRAEIIASNDLAREDELRKRNSMVEKYTTICDLFDLHFIRISNP